MRFIMKFQGSKLDVERYEEISVKNATHFYVDGIEQLQFTDSTA
jgi:hypothetical protein